MTGGRAQPAPGEAMPWGDSPSAVLTRLAGHWSITRTITPAGAFTGVAVVTALSAGALAYREEGRIRLPAGSFDACRSYRFEPGPTGFTAYFADAEPRLFHDVELRQMPDGAWVGNAPHPCGRDLYLTDYRFAPDGTFSIGHRVKGPNKDYAVASLYHRATAQEIAA